MHMYHRILFEEISISMRPSVSFIAASTILVSAAPAFALDDGFTLTGSLRLRLEEIEGQPRAGFDRTDRPLRWFCNPENFAF